MTLCRHSYRLSIFLILFVSTIPLLYWLTITSVDCQSRSDGICAFSVDSSALAHQRIDILQSADQLVASGVSAQRTNNAKLADRQIQQTPLILNKSLGSENGEFYYNYGKEVRYAEISCPKPDLISGYNGNPCWMRNGKLACAPKIVVLGIHKCGTTEMLVGMGGTQTYSNNINMWREKNGRVNRLQAVCPTDLFLPGRGKHTTGMMESVMQNKVLSISCDGCFNSSRTINNTDRYITIQSAAQYIAHFKTEQTRYIFTLRNPTDRMLSHYFYFLQIRMFKGAQFRGKNSQSGGNEFLHKQSEDNIAAIKSCLLRMGTTECILIPYQHKTEYPNWQVAEMITFGCYIVFIEEVIKHLPKEHIYFSIIEEYGQDRGAHLKDIYDFVGLNTTGEYDPRKREWEQKAVNKGSNKKAAFDKTIALLDDFFRPFNNRMAAFTKDDKWKFLRKTSGN